MQEKKLEHIQYTETAPEIPVVASESPSERRSEKREIHASRDSDAQSTGSSAGSSHQSNTSIERLSTDPEIVDIEQILSSGLDGFFQNLSTEHQLRFKTDGEAAALKIREMVHKQTTKIKDIVNIIIDWLKGLPGINRFFIEQEAKIKADTIMRRYRS